VTTVSLPRAPRGSRQVGYGPQPLRPDSPCFAGEAGAPQQPGTPTQLSGMLSLTTESSRVRVAPPLKIPPPLHAAPPVIVRFVSVAAAPPPTVRVVSACCPSRVGAGNRFWGAAGQGEALVKPKASPAGPEHGQSVAGHRCREGVVPLIAGARLIIGSFRAGSR
jgi:hypothetical protein